MYINIGTLIQNIRPGLDHLWIAGLLEDRGFYENYRNCGFTYRYRGDESGRDSNDD